MSASTSAALCLGLGSKVVGRQNIKQKCIRYFGCGPKRSGSQVWNYFWGRTDYTYGGGRDRLRQAGAGWGRLVQAAGRKEWVEFKRRSNVTALQKLEVEKDERSKVEVGFRRKCSDALPLCFVWLKSNYNFRASH